MQIVVLMGGVGERFRAAGYAKPKPFIVVDGKPMVEHVLDMYPGEHDRMLVIHEAYTDDPVIRRLIDTIPRLEIVPIPGNKLGPVATLAHVWERFEDDTPVMVSYCDFTATWDFSDFEAAVSSGAWDAAVPSYTGFHPHLVHRKKYAGLIADAVGRIIDMKEKHCFTEDPQESFHSAGNYYFSRAADLRRLGNALIESGETINGEQYVSMIYYHYLNEGKNVLAYPLTHFLQWGTPEDLEEYEAWSRVLRGQKPPSDIPQERESFVRIPHAEGSELFERSRAYWSDRFSRIT